MQTITKRANGSKRVTWRNPYNTKEMRAEYNGATWPEGLAAGEGLPSMAKQEFKIECDINTIVNAYMRTGDNELLGVAQQYYGDVSNLPKNYKESLDEIQLANAAFDGLPAKVRQEFNHDVAGLLDFVKDPKNKDRAIELGLIPKPEPVAVPVVPAAETAPTAKKNAPEGEN